MAETEAPVKETPVEEKASAAETPVEETPGKETKTEETPGKSDKKSSKKKVIVLLLLLLAIGIGVAVYFFLTREKETADDRIPYEQGVVLLGGEEIEPVNNGWIALTYNYKAFSRDGVHFSCLLSNSAANLYDLYFDIYADDVLQDQVFLSGLIPPGYGLNEIELNHALPAGTTKCYVVFNQVDTDEDGNQSIVNQMLVTVDFVVE